MNTLASKIVSVTVFTDRAQVTRQASVNLETGEHLLLFENLPQSIEQSSIQVNGTGKVVLRDIRFRKVYLANVPDENRKELFAEKEKLEDEIRIVDDKIKHAESEKSFVEDITRKITTSEKSKPFELEPESWIKMVEFYRTKLDLLDAEIRDTEKQKRNLGNELDKIMRQISGMGAGEKTAANVVEVAVEAKEPGNVLLELSYIAYGPKWIPVYDLRLSSDSKTMHISYNAFIQQSTSEDWDNVTLKLSTAQPKIGGKQPELTPWRIHFYTPVPVDYKMRTEKAAAPLMSQMLGEINIKTESAKEGLLEIPEAKVETKATSVLFAVAGSNTIKSNNEQHRVTIMIKEFPANFRYSAVPKLAPYAYLKAKVINNTDFPFLPGKSNVFLDSSFVANSKLDLVAPSEEFWTFLGVDEGIKVEHKLIKKHRSDKGLLAKKDKIEYEYLIEIKNNKKSEEEIVIWDQLPISGHEDIEIKLVKPDYKTDTEALKKNELNYLEWFFLLKPGEEMKIPFVFSVEYPKNSQVTGL